MTAIPRREPIAIIGMGCRFPGARDLAAFWQLLREGGDAITEVPKDRWDIDALFHPDPSVPGTMTSRFGGFLDDVDQFDPTFFGISPREAPHVDPRQRLVLEATWEALEDAGIPPDRLAGTRTSVFVATLTNDYDQMLFADLRRADALSGAGTATSTIANRVSYFLDLRGPSITVDTACSGSLVAMHLACESLGTGESSLALVGGVNVNLLPRSNVFFSKAGALSPTGRCRSFDRDADGMIRSDGVGIVVLKRLSDALADRDPIAAIVRGTAVNHGGRGNGIMAPTPEGQAAMLADAYRRAGVSPHDVQYIEAHGTGTRLGDPIEVQALAMVLAEGRPTNRSCLLGSVKTNIGHTEAAAGVAGIIKTALALKHRVVPASLNFDAPNPLIPFETLPFVVPRTLSAWPDASRPLFAGVSGFGFGGTNGHVVLEEPPPQTRLGDVSDPPFVIPVSARTPKALVDAVRALRNHVEQDTDDLADLSFTLCACRTHHAHRMAVVVDSNADLRAKLDTWLDTSALVSTDLHSANRPAQQQTPRHAHVPPAPSVRRNAADATPTVGTLTKSTFQSSPDVPQAPRQVRSFEMHSKAYLSGGVVDWATLFPHGGRVVPLPHYPWQRQRYWFDQLSGTRAEVSSRKRAGLRHPLLGERVEPAVRLETNGASRTLSLWEIDFESDRPRFLADHRVFGQVTLPAAVVAEMALAAGRELFAGREVEIVDLTFVRALVMPPGARQRAQVVLAATADEAEFTLFGRPARGATGSATWTMHANGQVRVVTQAPAASRIDLDAIRARCRSSVPLDAHYAGMAAHGLDCGPAFRAIVQLFSGIAESIAEIQLPATVSDQGYIVHPVLLDAALQTAAAALTDHDADVNARYRYGYLPSQIARWRVVRTDIAGSVWCHARLFGTPGDDHLTADIDLIESGGEVCAHVEGLRLVRIATASEVRIDDALLEVRWVAATIQTSPPPSSGAVLVLADDRGAGDALASKLRDAGCRVIVARVGMDFQRRGPDEFLIRPESPDDFHALLDLIGDPLQDVVHFWSLDAPAIDSGSVTDDAAFDRALRVGCGAALHVTQALVRKASPAALWCVTSGEILQSSLGGFALAVQQEHPELRCAVVDLDPAGIDDAASLLFGELTSVDREPQVRWRGGTRQVARLSRVSTPLASNAPGPMTLRSDVTYLVTGGLGSLGLQTAAMLVAQGARHLLLTGRHVHGPRPPAIVEMERHGATVTIAQADIARRADVERLFDETLPSMPPLRGVIHAAGVLDDGLLAQQTQERFAAVMAPKVNGAWHLHTRTKDLVLDFFICFSSMASMVGSAGQSNYAAANAFMDALAHLRRSEGLPALSVNWGAWADGGMADHGTVRQRLNARGVSLINGADALAWLSGVLRPDLTVCQVGVFPVEWSTFLRQFPRGAPPLFAAFAHEAVETPVSVDASVKDRLARAAVNERAILLRAYLRDVLASILGLDSAAEIGLNDRFFELGLDSLMAVEFSNRLEAQLGLALEATLAFDHPTLDALCTYLNDELTPRLPSSQTPSAFCEAAT